MILFIFEIKYYLRSIIITLGCIEYFVSFIKLFIIMIGYILY